MNANDQAKYQSLLEQGVPAELLDRVVAEADRRPARRQPDQDLIDRAMRLDILDAQIEEARLEQHQQTRGRLQRLGFDTSNFGAPLPERLPGEPTHLARLFERTAEPAAGGTKVAGLDPSMNAPLLIRPNTGEVVGVR